MRNEQRQQLLGGTSEESACSEYGESLVLLLCEVERLTNKNQLFREIDKIKPVSASVIELTFSSVRRAEQFKKKVNKIK